MNWTRVFLMTVLAGGCCNVSASSTSNGCGASSSGTRGQCSSQTDCNASQACVANPPSSGCSSGDSGSYCQDSNTPGICTGNDCPIGSHCIGATATIEGTCQEGCLTEAECGAGYECDVPLFGDGLGSCQRKPNADGGAGSAGSGGTGATGGSSGGGGAESCALSDAGTCGPALIANAICCPVIGHLYDDEDHCVIAGDSAVTVVGCIAVQSESSTCVYGTAPTCYEKDDGTMLLSTGELVDEALLDAEPCETMPDASTVCAGTAGAGGSPVSSGGGQGGTQSAGGKGAAGEGGAGG